MASVLIYGAGGSGQRLGPLQALPGMVWVLCSQGSVRDGEGETRKDNEGVFAVALWESKEHIDFSPPGFGGTLYRLVK